MGRLGIILAGLDTETAVVVGRTRSGTIVLMQVQ